MVLRLLETLFTESIEASGDLDVDGHTELDDLNVSGVSTFAGAIDANGDLDVDGHTELDDLNVSGVSTLGVTTFTGVVSFGTSAYFGDDDTLNFGDDNDLQIYHDGSHSFITDAGTGNLYIGADQKHYTEQSISK